MRKYFIIALIVSLIWVGGIVVFNISKEEQEFKNVLEEQKPFMGAEKEKNISNEATMNNLLKHIGFAEEALSKFEISSPEEALNLWLQGIESGNGVLQYAVMDSRLQQEFKVYLQKKKNLSWDTRSEDRIIDKYEIMEHTDVSEKVKIYKVKFSYIDNKGIAGEKYNNLTIVNENNRWVISSIQ